MILCVTELLERSRRAKNNRCCQVDIAHSVVSRLWKSFKTTGMWSRRHGEVVLEVRCLQKTDISSYQQKGTGAAQQVANQFLAASCRSPKNCCQTFLYARRPVVCVPLTRQHRTARLQMSITIGPNRTGHAYYSQMSRFSLSSDCRCQLIWREWYCFIVQKISRKRTDIRHAVLRCEPAS
ncbi:hypothetical protein TNCV_1397271 [Trichonephila clavipes]|nr:hypothetical protein TNCV_1397271 [Trichonephila clavipes]